MPTGPSSSQSPYIVGLEPNIHFTSVISTGDTFGSSSGVFGGVPDGIGAHDNGDGTVSVFVNHELGSTVGTTRAHGGIGAYVDEIVINKATLAAQSGGDLMQNVYLYNTTTQGYDLTTGINFSRFCSSDLADQKAFYNAGTGNGTQNLIYLTGEEDNTTGRAMGIVASGADKGAAYELAWFGNVAWENLVANPNSGEKTVVIGDQDGGGGHVLVYVGDKQATGNDIEKAGLAGGSLYGIQVNGLVDESNATDLTSGTTFTLALVAADASGLNAAQTDAAAEAAGATSFLRPEDGAWDPTNPNRYYFVTTNNITSPSRLWALDFIDGSNPTLGGTITELLDGTEGTGPEGVHRMFDNITVDATTGHVILQEDPGNQPRIAQLWDYDPATDTLRDIAQHDPARFSPPGTFPYTQDEESSGVIDVSAIFGSATRQAYLLDVQAHYPAANDPYLNGTITGVNVAPTVVEGGQLLLMTVDKPVTQGNALSNVLFGSYADETFNGLGGNDDISAGSGNDILNGGTGNDLLNAGAGDDTLNGGTGDDVLNGGDGNDKLNGASGRDVMDGGAGDDTLSGGGENDILVGGAGADKLLGGSEDDVLTGGAGADILTGNADSDRFVFLATSDSTTGSVDRIADFKHLEGDIIDLSAIDADTITAGDQGFHFVGTFQHIAGDLVLTKTGSSTIIYGDVNGDAVVDFQLQVITNTALTSVDFFL